MSDGGFFVRFGNWIMAEESVRLNNQERPQGETNMQ